MLLDGILPVYKELNLRSTDCVSMVKKILPRYVKIGHAGTLDSTAEGILILLVGKTTRLADFIMKMPKIYKATVKFGAQTSTDDASGNVVATQNTDHLTNDLILETLPKFLGIRAQIPPNISAVHIDGKRAHDLARSGENFQISPKNIQIIHIKQTKELFHNCAEFLIECKKGTYIRSFARDLGVSLGTVAHIASLKRVSVWKFVSSRAISSNALSNLNIKSLQDCILHPKILSGYLPTYEVNDSGEEALKNGLELPIANTKLLTLGQSDLKNKSLTIGNNLLSLCNLTQKNAKNFISPKCNICFASEQL